MEKEDSDDYLVRELITEKLPLSFAVPTLYALAS
jgi:hypothetical protein